MKKNRLMAGIPLIAVAVFTIGLLISTFFYHSLTTGKAEDIIGAFFFFPLSIIINIGGAIIGVVLAVCGVRLLAEKDEAQMEHRIKRCAILSTVLTCVFLIPQGLSIVLMLLTAKLVGVLGILTLVVMAISCALCFVAKANCKRMATSAPVENVNGDRE